MTTSDQKKLTKIDSQAKRYSAARSRLTRHYSAFKRKLDALQAKHLPKIKAALDEAANVKSQLEVAISAGPELFREPRTLVLHGVRVGMMDGQVIVKLPRAKKKLDVLTKYLREHFTEEQIAALDLIEGVILHVPRTDAIAKAIAAGIVNPQELPGVDYAPAGERVFIKPADHALDKVITALLKEGLQKGNGASADEDDGEHQEAA